MTILVNVIIVLLIVGAILYILPRVPIDNTIKLIIQVLVIIAVVIYLLQLVTGVKVVG
jgi:hypothetical protein